MHLIAQQKWDKINFMHNKSSITKPINSALFKIHRNNGDPLNQDSVFIDRDTF